MRFLVYTDDGQPVQLQRTGRGRPLLLLHEWTADHSVWRHFIPELADSFTVHAWDARGHGATGSKPGYPSTSRTPCSSCWPTAATLGPAARSRPTLQVSNGYASGWAASTRPP